MKISGECFLVDLHLAILNSIGFENDHAYVFFMNNRIWDMEEAYYTKLNRDTINKKISADEIRLNQLNLKVSLITFHLRKNCLNIVMIFIVKKLLHF